MNFSYKKYAGLIIGISAFLLLEVASLFFSANLSIEIAKDAEAVNIAGRQRMLSQRITKSLLDSKNFLYTGNKNSTSELSKAADLFNSTINAFNQGGEIIGADSLTTLIQPVTTVASKIAVTEGLSIWKNYKQLIDTALTAIQEGSNSQDIALQQAIDYGRENNLTLLKLMNDLTVDLEGVASSKADKLELIHTVGLLLTILIFLALFFFSLRQLFKSDRIIAQQQIENDQILETVEEGLFLVDADFNIGEQQSTKTSEIFSHTDTIKEDLLGFLGDYISAKDKETTKEYFDLLFDERKPEKLITELNPLKQVAIQVPDSNLGFIKKSLRFTFKRVIEDNTIKRILTTISDITTEIKLKEDLAKSEKAQSDQMNMLTLLINTDQKVMNSFIKMSAKNYTKINATLKEETDSNSELIHKAQKVMTIMHGVKGEASALSIKNIANLAHDFENLAQELIEKITLSGEDFIPLTVILEKMISYNETINGLNNKLFTAKSNNSENQEHLAPIHQKQQWENLYNLSDQIAQRQGKSVEFISSGLNDYSLSNSLHDFINTAAIQLIRNSINHGIETTEKRHQLGKKDTGLLTLNLYQFKDKSFELVFKDDGKGIDLDKLGQRAIEAKIITAKQLEELSNRQIISLMFHKGLSTADSIDQDSGRGVGMSLLWEKAQEVGGKINIQTSKNSGTAIKIKIPSSILQNITSEALDSSQSIEQNQFA